MSVNFNGPNIFSWDYENCPIYLLKQLIPFSSWLEPASMSNTVLRFTPMVSTKLFQSLKLICFYIIYNRCKTSNTNRSINTHVQLNYLFYIQIVLVSTYVCVLIFFCVGENFWTQIHLTDLDSDHTIILTIASQHWILDLGGWGDRRVLYHCHSLISKWLVQLITVPHVTFPPCSVMS